MSVQERIVSIVLLNRVKRNPRSAKELGIKIERKNSKH